jgi:mRNA interferase MazF
VTRRDVYRVQVPAGRGHEQRGPRYGVIVQADVFLGLATVLVAPTTRVRRGQIAAEGSAVSS